MGDELARLLSLPRTAACRARLLLLPLLCPPPAAHACGQVGPARLQHCL